MLYYLFQEESMIYDKLENISNYFNSDSDFVKAIDFITVFNADNGKYPIDGNDLIVNVDSYKTSPESTKVFEAHRKYIDIQVMLEGTEIQGVTPLDNKNLTITEDYDCDRDVIFFDTDSDYSRILLSPGEFVVYFPGDCHKPGCSVDHDCNVRKIVAKIAVKDLG